MNDCIFCKIIAGEIPGKFVYRDEKSAAFYDISPKAPVHVLVVPVTHIESLAQVNDDDKELLGNLMLNIKSVAQKTGIDKTGFKVIANNGEGSGQLVPHLHFHVLGGWGEKPKGVFI